MATVRDMKLRRMLSDIVSDIGELCLDEAMSEAERRTWRSVAASIKNVIREIGK